MTKTTVNIGVDIENGLDLLSNFAATPFEVDGVDVHTAEGLIQGVKFEDECMQREVCALSSGLEAKHAGRNANKRIERELQSQGSALVFWQGRSFGFRSPEHFALLRRALEAKFASNAAARTALLSTGHATLIHDLGHPESPMTSLPAEVFCKMLGEIRATLAASA